ncbi:unnamed protein product [Schistosoma margrebowiei]|uniref:Uncharacterized protein n=1 Tax=Schistosoma margrebowiei TaxID=48269 RepID=A0A183MCG7_9TREM|nr:unnamed protein product [Schistosoma margrebowiei]
MVVGGSQQETQDPGFVLLGTRQQGVPVILRELVLPGGFDLVSPSFTVRDVTTGSDSSVLFGVFPFFESYRFSCITIHIIAYVVYATDVDRYK